MKLSTLLEILKPLMEKCNDELAVYVSVFADNGEQKINNIFFKKS